MMRIWLCLPLPEQNRRAERASDRIDALQPLLVRPDPDAAFAVGVDGECVVVGDAAVLRREGGEPAALRIEPADAAGPRRDPDLAGPVFSERQHRVGIQVARRLAVVLELPARAVEAIEPSTVGRDPGRAACVLEERHHGVEAQARGVARDGTEPPDRVAVLQRDVDAAGEGAEPERSGLIAMDRPDGVAVQPPRVVGVELIVRETSRGEVEVVEPSVLRADPQPASPVEVERVHRVDRDAVRIVGVVLIEGDAAGGTIQLRQAAVGERHVDGALGVLDELTRVFRPVEGGRVGVLGIDVPGLQRASARIELERARAPAGDPQMLAAVLEETLDLERGQLTAVRRRLACRTIELVEAARGAQPERALRLENCADLDRVGRDDAKVLEGVALAVIAAEASGRAHPECLLRVLVDREGVAGGEAGRVAVAMTVDGESVAVVAVQALGGAEPHETAAVLVDGRDARAGEAVVGGQRPELKLLGVRARAREREGAEGERSSPDSRTKAPDYRRRVSIDAECGSSRRHLCGKASINDARNRVLQQPPVGWPPPSERARTDGSATRP